MNKVVLPSNSFGEFVFGVLLMLGIIIFSIIMAVLAYRRTGGLFKRAWRELPKSIGRPLALRLLLNNTCILYVLLMILAIWGIWSIFNQGFVAFDYDADKICLHYHYTSKPIVLYWPDIYELSLEKERSHSKWTIVIKMQNGETYRSNTAPTHREIGEMESAYLKIKEELEKPKG
jgi:hypothetical protein